LVEASWPFPHWQKARKLHLAGIGLLMLLSPFFYADMLVMLPAALTFVFALGPIRALARVVPTCLRCGGPVTATSLRVVPGSGLDSAAPVDREAAR
jgi:hypothetical protein